MPLPAPGTTFKSRLQSSLPSKSQPLAQDVEPETKRETGHPVLRPSLGRPLSFQSDVEGSKRRSMLPQLGQPIYSSRLEGLSNDSDRDAKSKEPDLIATEPENVPISKDVGVQSSVPGRLRPRSMYQNGPTRTERVTRSDDTPPSRSMLPPASVSKPSEPKPTGLSRSQSLRRPGVTMQSAQPRETTVHARTQSVNTTGITRKATMKSNTGSERPKSLLVAPNSNLKTNSVPGDRALHNTKVSTRIADNRSSSIKARLEVLSGSARTATAARAEEPLVPQPRQRQPEQEEPKRIARPAFSTLQQHFTPRKTSKAPTATFLHPAPVLGANALPPEVVSLQSELLQLHLLHEVSGRVSSQWESSAKRSLHKKFEEVASMYQVMLELERAGQEQKNLQSLLEWSGGKSSAGLIEYIQILSGPLHELPSLVEKGGRMQRVVSDFEHWMSRVQEVQSARGDSTEQNGSSGTIEGLGDSWKAETAGLIRKISSFAGDLRRLDQPTPGSSVACIIDTCMALLREIMDELHTMQSIDADVVRMEKDWVQDRLRAIAQDIGPYPIDTSMESLAWRT